VKSVNSDPFSLLFFSNNLLSLTLQKGGKGVLSAETNFENPIKPMLLAPLVSRLKVVW
jgi:hypothetical protein